MRRWIRTLEFKGRAIKVKVVEVEGLTLLETTGVETLNLLLVIRMNLSPLPTTRRMPMASQFPKLSLPTSARLESGRATLRKRK
jgi:hypothetical protein